MNKRTETYNTGQYHNATGDGMPKPWNKIPTGDILTGSGSSTSGNTAGSAGMPVAPGGSGLDDAGEASEAMQWLTGLFGGDRPTPETQTVDVNTGAGQCVAPMVLDKNGVCKNPSNNTVWWVVGGVSVAAFIGVIVWAIAGKKGK